MKGTIKFWSRCKGWGFITTDDGADIFIHHAQARGENGRYVNFVSGEHLEFDIEDIGRGPRAVRVQRTGVFEP